MMGRKSEVIQSPVRAPWNAMPNMPSLVSVLAISRSSSQVSGGLSIRSVRYQRAWQLMLQGSP